MQRHSWRALDLCSDYTCSSQVDKDRERDHSDSVEDPEQRFPSSLPIVRQAINIICKWLLFSQLNKYYIHLYDHFILIIFTVDNPFVVFLTLTLQPSLLTTSRN